MEHHRHIFSLPAYRLENGTELPVRLAWQAWGRLSAARDNAVLICHYFSGSSQAAGPGGWWSDLIGPGRPFDTNRHYVLCLATLNNINKAEVSTLAPGATVRDSVRLQKLLLEQLGIQRLLCVAGPSMGGMQALTWAVEYPEVPAGVVAAITADRNPPFTGLVPVEAGIGAVTADPEGGLARAALIMTTTARGPKWVERALVRDGYIEQMWSTARERAAAWDRDRWVQMARAWQRFDLAAGYPDRRTALARIQAAILLLPVSTDLFFPPELSQEFAAELRALGKDARCTVIESHGGHLAGVAECGLLAPAIRDFLG